MNYILLTIGENEYKLTLTTKGCVQLERVLGYNPVQLLLELDSGKLPKLSDMIMVLNVMLSQYQHGITIDKVYDIIDAFKADGHQIFELIPIFTDVFKQSGFIAPDAEEEESKN